MTNKNIEADDDGSGVSGGLVALILIIAFALLGGYLLWIESPTWFGGFVQERFEAALASSSISESEQSELIDIMDQLTDRINDRTIGWTDMPDIMSSIADSEFAPIAFSLYLQSSAVHPLELSDETRARTHQTVLRLGWAVQNNAIPQDKLDPLWEMLGNSPGERDADWLAKEIVLSEEKLLKFLSEAEPLLAEYEVPLEPYTFDYSESLQRALQRYLDAE